MDNTELARILGNARKVMNKVENNSFSTGHVNESAMKVDSSSLLTHVPDGHQAPTSKGPQYIQEKEGPAGVAGKNLPANIRKLMEERPIEVPIPRSMGGGSFSLEDVESLVVKKPTPSQPTQPLSQPSHLSQPTKMNRFEEEYVPTTPAPRKIVREESYSSDSDVVMISKSELKNMMNEVLLNFMTTFSTNLKETTIKETISTLIREGKISINKKQ